MTDRSIVHRGRAVPADGRHVVTGHLEQAHSSDPDMLASRKQELVQKRQPMKPGS